MFIFYVFLKSPWFCKKCNPPPARKSTKCKKCNHVIKRDKLEIKCFKCKRFFHSKCSKISFDKFRLNKFWVCDFCANSTLPFSNLNDEDMRLTLIGQDVPVSHNLSIHPTFAIKTLLDKMPGSISIRAGDLNDSISSKYYTPTEFITSKVKKNNFSIFHFNIASLQYHIDDLRAI